MALLVKFGGGGLLVGDIAVCCRVEVVQDRSKVGRSMRTPLAVSVNAR